MLIQFVHSTQFLAFASSFFCCATTASSTLPYFHLTIAFYFVFLEEF